MPSPPQEREELVAYWERTGHKVLWGTLPRLELEAALATDPVVLLPIGSVEQHGPACELDDDIVGAYPCVCGRRRRSPPLPAWSYHRCRTHWRHTTWAGSARLRSSWRRR